MISVKCVALLCLGTFHDVLRRVELMVDGGPDTVSRCDAAIVELNVGHTSSSGGEKRHVEVGSQR